MLCVEFPQVQYIDLSEIVHVLKTFTMVTREHINLSTIFMFCHFLSAKVSGPWLEVKPWFQGREKASLSPE